MKNLNMKKVSLGVGALAVAGIAGSALAAAITVPGSNAGQGEGEVSGYTVSNIEYTTDVTDGNTTVNDAKVTAVDFDLDIAADTVFVRLLSDVGTDGAWASCTPAGTAVSCTLTTAESINIADVDDLDVVAYQSA